MNLTYTQNIPAADHNPSNDQNPMMVNFNSIYTWTNGDHYGFEDGQRGTWHKVIHLPQISGNSTPPPTTTPVPAGQLYTKTSSGAVELFYEDNLGNETQLSNALGTHPVARAAVNFSVSAGPVITINNSFNVASVVRNAIGVYTITYTTALSTEFYYPCISGQTPAPVPTGTTAMISSTISNNSYIPTVSSIQIKLLNGNSGAAVDPIFCSVAIFL